MNPDKPQEAARVLVLEQGKDLYVPVPRLKDGLLKHITVIDNTNKNQIREAVSRRGIEFDGRIIGIDDDIKIDLLVLGSVAVSKQGHRIGKGKGYADLEFAVLLEMKAVTEETLIVTVVHDSQVHFHIIKKRNCLHLYLLTDIRHPSQRALPTSRCACRLHFDAYTSNPSCESFASSSRNNMEHFVQSTTKSYAHTTSTQSET